MRFLLRSVVFLMRHTPIKVIALLGLGVGYLSYYLAGSRRRIVKRNLRICIDPSLRDRQLRPLVRRNMALTCMNFACAMKVGVMSDQELSDSVRLVGKDVFENAGTEGNTGIACIPHAGNWEILARIRPLFTKVKTFGSMYRKLRNPDLEQIVYDLRTGYGCQMYSKEAGLRRVVRMTRTGGLIGILSDQYTEEGVYVPYFGKVTGTTPFPAVLHSMCKGRLFAVHTRNRGLGRWDAVLGEEIHLNYKGTDQAAADTLSINLALENSQKVSILDGFWMHHRWKSRRLFGLQGQDQLAETVAPFVTLPFRILVALPECFEEAILCLPALRILSKCRFDAELSVISTTGQRDFWQTQKHLITHVFTMDEKLSLSKQLAADEIYAKGPFDYLFMWSENARTWRQLRSIDPITSSGFEENKLVKKFTENFTSAHCGPVRHKFRDYLALLEKRHELDCSAWEEEPGEREGVEQYYIAPFSTLGRCEEQWSIEQWRELVEQLTQQGKSCKLLALPDDGLHAAEYSEKLKIEHELITEASLPTVLGSRSTLICVDGIIPQLAALTHARIVVMMASRLSKRYRPLSRRARVLYHHSSCHPCYRKTCDAASPCVTAITVAAVLDEIEKLG